MSQERLNPNTYEDLPHPLSIEQFEKLFDEMKEGKVGAEEQIIIHNMRYVIYLVNTQFNNTSYDKEDLIQIGMIGLLKALRSYQKEKGVKFISYASRVITNEILMYMRSQNKYLKEDCIDNIILQMNNGDSFTYLDILESLELGPLETYLENENKMELNEIYPCIFEILKSLPKRDCEIVLYYYSLKDGKYHTQEEIGAYYHISRSYVSRIIQRSLKKVNMKLRNLSTEKEKILKK